ncbi:AMP-binding protein [Streptomyces sp. NPDC017993]|uniref:AMP-binding protein n=1 Tax=Streptomyces sp. NPDC017993 TaxID=3365027 RepID=UPI0037A5E6BB
MSQGTQRWTYQDLAQVTSHMVSALRGSMEREGPVAILAGNRPHTLAVHLAGHVLGRPVAHLARDSARPGLEAFLRELRPAALVFDPADAATAKDLTAAVPCGRLLSLGPGPEATDLLAETTARRPGEAFAPQSAPRDQIRTLLCTGGSTGAPKGVVHTVVHTHRMYEALLDAMAGADGAGVRRLLRGEISHLSWYIGIPALMAGGTLFLHEGFDADRLLKAVSTDRLTRITLTPAQLVRVLEHPDLAATDLSSLQCVLYGTAPTPPQRLREALRRFGPVLQGVYGLPGLITSFPPADHVDGTPDVLSSVGRPAPGASVEVRDAQGRPSLTGRPATCGSPDRA